MSTHFRDRSCRFWAGLLRQGPIELVDEGGLRSFGLGDAFQADAAASAKLEPDFHHLDAGKLIEQLPWGQRGRAGSKFALKTHPQAVSQEGDHDVGFDPLGGEVPDRTDGHIGFERADDSFNLGELDVLAPEFGRIGPL